MVLIAVDEVASLLSVGFVDGLVFGDALETQVLLQTRHLLFGQRFFQEIGHFSDASTQILRHPEEE